ncbi:MAG: MlaD family protein [Kiritimatiellae bacterium]|nr:MlaD family protein [Kiritimatiellia bacterium]
MNENRANYAKIGFFVLTGAALMLLAIGIAGSRVFNKRVVLAETYFAESITGLDIGSPVKYRGVPVGEVKRIGFVYSAYGIAGGKSLDHAAARQIMVVMALDPERFGLLDSQDAETVLETLVTHGLRVKTSMSGVTGLAFLELDYVPLGKEAASVDEISWKPRNPYIPATLSTMTTIKKSIDDVFVKLSAIDLPKLGDELLATLTLLQDKLNNVDVSALSGEATVMLHELRDTNRALKQLVESPELAALPAEFAATVASARRSAEGVEAEITPLARSLAGTVARSEGLLDALQGMVTNNSDNVYEAVTALRQTSQTLSRTALVQQDALDDLVSGLKRASEGLDRLVRELGDNPAALLFGRPPEELPETRAP